MYVKKLCILVYINKIVNRNKQDNNLEEPRALEDHMRTIHFTNYIVLHSLTYLFLLACQRSCSALVDIARQMGHRMGGNFNIHIWAWSASPSVQVGRL